jgi:hypothetical protein
MAQIHQFFKEGKNSHFFEKVLIASQKYKRILVSSISIFRI